MWYICIHYYAYAMPSATPASPRPAAKSVRINAATMRMVEKLQARHLAAFGSAPSIANILQRACEVYCLDGQLPPLPSGAAETPAHP